MIEFIYHDAVEKEIAMLERRFRHLRNALQGFQRICEEQFNPLNPRQIIGPGKLHRVTQNDIWTLWKVELVIPGSGLRPNQFPRLWFAVKGSMIVFLCISTHVDNYRDNDVNRIALQRATDVF